MNCRPRRLARHVARRMGACRQSRAHRGPGRPASRRPGDAIVADRAGCPPCRTRPRAATRSASCWTSASAKPTNRHASSADVDGHAGVEDAEVTGMDANARRLPTIRHDQASCAGGSPPVELLRPGRAPRRAAAAPRPLRAGSAAGSATFVRPMFRRAARASVSSPLGFTALFTLFIGASRLSRPQTGPAFGATRGLRGGVRRAARSRRPQWRGAGARTSRSCRFSPSRAASSTRTRRPNSSPPSCPT